MKGLSNLRIAYREEAIRVLLVRVYRVYHIGYIVEVVPKYLLTYLLDQYPARKLEVLVYL